MSLMISKTVGHGGAGSATGSGIPGSRIWNILTSVVDDLASIIANNVLQATDAASLRTQLTAALADYAAGRAEIIKLVTDYTAGRAEIIKLVTDYTAGRAEIVKAIADALTQVNGTYPCVSAALAIGSTKAQVATGAFAFQIAGMRYAKAAVAAGTAFTATTHDIADGDENTFLLSINAAGTITISIGTPGTGSGNAGAIASVPAGGCAIGLLTIFASGAIFNATTDDLDAAHLTDTYVNYTLDSQVAGETAQTAANPAAVTAANPAAVTAANPAAVTAATPAAATATSLTKATTYEGE